MEVHEGQTTICCGKSGHASWLQTLKTKLKNIANNFIFYCEIGLDVGKNFIALPVVKIWSHICLGADETSYFSYN